MSILIVLTVLSLAGIGAALWLLKNDPESDEKPSLTSAPPEPKTEADTPQEPQRKAPLKKKSALGGILSKLNVKKKSTLTQKPPEEPSFKEPKKSSSPLSGLLAKIGAGSLLAKLKLGEKGPEKREDKETEPLRLHEMLKEDKGKDAHLKKDSANDSDLQEKYQKLDELFKEKSAELSKIKESLENELKHRQEFTKIQTILESEIKEYKEKLNQAQSENKEPNAEIEEYKEEVASLQKRVAGLVKDLVESEKEVNTLKSQSMFSEFKKQEEPPAQEPPEGEGEEEKTPKTTPMAEPSEEQPQEEDEDTQLIRSLGSQTQTPPEPYATPSEDDSPEEKQAPDVPEQESSPETPQEEPKDKEEDFPQMHLMTEPSDEEASENETGQMSGTLGPQPPPESEESFLKLQPDIASEESENPEEGKEPESAEPPPEPEKDTQEPEESPQDPEEKPQATEEKPKTSEKSSSIADEIESSIHSTMEPESSSEPEKENPNENTEDTKE